MGGQAFGLDRFSIKPFYTLFGILDKLFCFGSGGRGANGATPAALHIGDGGAVLCRRHGCGAGFWHSYNEFQFYILC